MGVCTRVLRSGTIKSVANITNSATAYIQNNVNSSTTHAKTTTSEGPLFTTKEVDFSYPITVNYNRQLQSNGNITAQTSIDQKFQREETDTVEGFTVFHSSTSDEVTPADTALFILTPNGYELGQNSHQSSKQAYVYQDSFGHCYSKTLAAAANVLTAIESGRSCQQHGFPW
jgi:hypothetical protein